MQSIGKNLNEKVRELLKNNMKRIFYKINNFWPISAKTSFDVYQRYKIVSDLISNLECDSVLDVGGGFGTAKVFLKDKDVLTIDLSGGDIIGNGVALPFKNGSFDIVVSLDVLHYVPPEQRDLFLGELARAARKFVIITNPFEDMEIREAEIECNEFYRRLYGKEYKWLKAGFHEGLPDLIKVKNRFFGHKIETYNNGSLYYWIIMLKLDFIYEKSILFLPVRYMTNLIYNLIIYNFTKNNDRTFRKILLINLNNNSNNYERKAI